MPLSMIFLLHTVQAVLAVCTYPSFAKNRKLHNECPLVFCLSGMPIGNATRSLRVSRPRRLSLCPRVLRTKAPHVGDNLPSEVIRYVCQSP
ncbi:hypothetical protein F4861DRAFT_223273 [Xylaria intraflava]|nr:hypothetical protein F4861DRAFT_223273 [Xylaria intraflava]